MTNQDGGEPPSFVETKSYRRFGEMCDACRRARVVGLGYGPLARAKPNRRSGTRNGACSNPSCQNP
jgi:DNA transposition AAA+ family ATPase